jgi:IS605 OrfB family transposase
MCVDYKHDVQLCVNKLVSGELPLANLHLPEFVFGGILKHSHYVRDIYSKASQIVRGEITVAENRRFECYQEIYKELIEADRHPAFTNKRYSELNLKHIFKSRFFTIPVIKNITIDLAKDLVDIQEGKHFDNFVRLKLPYFNERGTLSKKIKIPVKNYQHANKFIIKGYIRKTSIQIKKVGDKMFVNFLWQKDEPIGNPKFKIKNKSKHKVKLNPANYSNHIGNSMGIDLGYKKLIVTSKGQVLGTDMIDLYKEIADCTRNTKKYKRLIKERNNKMNYYVNQIDFEGISVLKIEDLKDVKKDTKGKFSKNFNAKLASWVYGKIINKITMICEDKGILLEKVSPAYTSQTCSSCKSVHKESRKGEKYECIDCGLKIDADYNAAINISNRGSLQSP